MFSKNTLLIGAAAIVVGLSTLSAQADYVSTVESYNPLGYWRFTTSTQANSKVNGYTGTLEGGAAVGATGTGPALVGHPGNAPLDLTANGSSVSPNPDSYVTTSLTGQINQSGTMVAWINMAELPSAAGRYFYIAGESQVGNDFDIQVETDNVLRFYTEGGGNVAAPTAFTASNVNTWIMVAASFTANSSRDLYINGQLVASNTPGGHSLDTSPFTMGASSVFGNRWFNGGIDEVAVYNSQLSSADILNIYNSASTVPEPAALSLLAMGGLGLLLKRRRNTEATA